MNIVDKATETQLKNIQTRTGKTLAELAGIVHKSGLTKHGRSAICSRETWAWAMAMPIPSSPYLQVLAAGFGPSPRGAEDDAVGGSTPARRRPCVPSTRRSGRRSTGLAPSRSPPRRLPQLAAQETVRHGRPGDQYAGRGGAEHERRSGDVASEGNAPGRHVRVQSQPDGGQRGRPGTDGLGQDGLRGGGLSGGTGRPLTMSPRCWVEWRARRPYGRNRLNRRFGPDRSVLSIL